MELKDMTEEEIVVKYERLAKRLASKAYNSKKHLLDTRFMDYEDLLQYAYIGIIDAVRSYDENKGASFMTYAWACVYNRICRDAFRSKWVNSYIKFGDFSLDETVNEDGDTTLLELTGEESKDLEDVVFKDIQIKLFNRLNKEDRQLLVMHNVEGKTFREMAVIFGVSHQLIRQKVDYTVQQLKVQYMRECKKYA